MSDVMYIEELAERLDTTVEAIRGHIKRRTDAIPPWFRRGSRRIAWRRTTVTRWLDEQEAAAMRETVVRPARRRLGGNTSSAS